jgi:glutamine synthetase adenylyltransferase
MNSQLGFEEYMAKNGRYWENYFKIKDRTAGPKIALKKKKKKGTIPI